MQGYKAFDVMMIEWHNIRDRTCPVLGSEVLIMIHQIFPVFVFIPSPAEVLLVEWRIEHTLCCDIMHQEHQAHHN